MPELSDGFPGFLLGGAQEIERDTADGGDCERRVVFADAAGIFAEGHVQAPSAMSFQWPVTAGGFQNGLRVWRQGGEVIAFFGGGFPARSAGGGDADDTA